MCASSLPFTKSFVWTDTGRKQEPFRRKRGTGAGGERGSSDQDHNSLLIYHHKIATEPRSKPGKREKKKLGGTTKKDIGKKRR